MTVLIDKDFPNRIQLKLGSVTGPLSQTTLGAFSSSRDLEIYINGILATVTHSDFDGINNRYLIYVQNPIATDSIVQVIHHVPSPAFTSSTTVYGTEGLRT